MTTDLNDVLMELDSKIAEVYDLDLAEEMTGIYIDLTDRVNEFSSQYWKLVKALAKTEKERDDLVMEYNGLLEEHNKTLKKYEGCLRRNNGTLKQYNETSREYYGTLKDAAKMIEKVKKERDQAEYDRDYYRDEIKWLRNEVEWHRKEAEKERRLRVTAEYEKELAEMELLGQEVRYDLDD